MNSLELWYLRNLLYIYSERREVVRMTKAKVTRKTGKKTTRTKKA